MKGFDHFRGLLFEFILQNQETKECQTRFNFFSLAGLRGLFCHFSQFLGSQCNYSVSLNSKSVVHIIELVVYVRAERCNFLRSTLDESSKRIAIHYDNALTHQLRFEVKPFKKSQFQSTFRVLDPLCYRVRCIIFVQFPTGPLKHLDVEWVSNQLILFSFQLEP